MLLLRPFLTVALCAAVSTPCPGVLAKGGGGGGHGGGGHSSGLGLSKSAQTGTKTISEAQKIRDFNRMVGRRGYGGYGYGGYGYGNGTNPRPYPGATGTESRSSLPAHVDPDQVVKNYNWPKTQASAAESAGKKTDEVNLAAGKGEQPAASSALPQQEK